MATSTRDPRLAQRHESKSNNAAKPKPPNFNRDFTEVMVDLRMALARAQADDLERAKLLCSDHAQAAVKARPPIPVGRQALIDLQRDLNRVVLAEQLPLGVSEADLTAALARATGAAGAIHPADPLGDTVLALLNTANGGPAAVMGNAPLPQWLGANDTEREAHFIEILRHAAGDHALRTRFMQSLQPKDQAGGRKPYIDFSDQKEISPADIAALQQALRPHWQQHQFDDGYARQQIKDVPNRLTQSLEETLQVASDFKGPPRLAKAPLEHTAQAFKRTATQQCHSATLCPLLSRKLSTARNFPCDTKVSLEAVARGVAEAAAAAHAHGLDAKGETIAAQAVAEVLLEQKMSVATAPEVAAALGDVAGRAAAEVRDIPTAPGQLATRQREAAVTAAQDLLNQIRAQVGGAPGAALTGAPAVDAACDWERRQQALTAARTHVAGGGIAVVLRQHEDLYGEMARWLSEPQRHLREAKDDPEKTYPPDAKKLAEWQALFDKHLHLQNIQRRFLEKLRQETEEFNRTAEMLRLQKSLNPLDLRLVLTGMPGVTPTEFTTKVQPGFIYEVLKGSGVRLFVVPAKDAKHCTAVRCTPTGIFSGTRAREAMELVLLFEQQNAGKFTTIPIKTVPNVDFLCHILRAITGIDPKTGREVGVPVRMQIQLGSETMKTLSEYEGRYFDFLKSPHLRHNRVQALVAQHNQRVSNESQAERARFHPDPHAARHQPQDEQEQDEAQEEAPARGLRT